MKKKKRAKSVDTMEVFIVNHSLSLDSEALPTLYALHVHKIYPLPYYCRQ
jgi:hypothetical protein